MTHMSMDTIGILGFVVLLVSWFGMFFRVRRDHPGHPLADYSSYIGPRMFGSRSRSGFSLLPFYRQHYGTDGWFLLAMAGLALLAVAAIAIAVRNR